jgi:hypothetical protein
MIVKTIKIGNATVHIHDDSMHKGIDSTGKFKFIRKEGSGGNNFFERAKAADRNVSESA